MPTSSASFKQKQPIFSGNYRIRGNGRSAGRQCDSVAAQHDPARATRSGEEPDSAGAHVDFLDERIPVIAGCEINDNPFAPDLPALPRPHSGAWGRTPIDYRSRDERYVEKLATPDVTIADMIGDIDPIKAAKGGHAIGSELSVHYGLLPRANRGIFRDQ